MPAKTSSRWLAGVEPVTVFGGEVDRGGDRRRVQRVGEADRRDDTDQPQHT